jgi:hypothetical protein
VSGQARTADVFAQIQVKITDTATEGEMLDAVVAAVGRLNIALQAEGGSAEVSRVVRASVVTRNVGGHL